MSNERAAWASATGENRERWQQFRERLASNGATISFDDTKLKNTQILAGGQSGGVLWPEYDKARPDKWKYPRGMEEYNALTGDTLGRLWERIRGVTSILSSSGAEAADEQAPLLD